MASCRGLRAGFEGFYKASWAVVMQSHDHLTGDADNCSFPPFSRGSPFSDGEGDPHLYNTHFPTN